MPAKKSSGEANGAGNGSTATINPMTEGEMKFIKAMFDNMTQRPDANWDKVAADLGLKDSKCAKERFRQMSVKHGWRDGLGVATPRKVKAGPATATSTTPSK